MRLNQPIAFLFSAIAIASNCCGAQSAVTLTLLSQFSVDSTAARNSLGSLCFSPDGSQLAIGVGYDGSIGSRGEIQLWDWRRRVHLQTYPGHGGTVRAVVFTRDSRWLIGGGYRPKIWDLSTGRVARELERHGMVFQLVVPANGDYLLTSERRKGVVRVWDLQTGKLRTSFPGNPTADRNAPSIASIALSMDGQTVYVGGYRLEVTAWNTKDWSLKREYSIPEPKHKYLTDHTIVRYDASTHRLFLKRDSRDVPGRIVSADTGQLICDLKNTSDFISFNDGCFALAGKVIVFGGFGGFGIWDTQTGERLYRARSDSLAFASASRSGDVIAVGSPRGSISIFKIEEKAGNPVESRD